MTQKNGPGAGKPTQKLRKSTQIRQNMNVRQTGEFLGSFAAREMGNYRITKKYNTLKQTDFGKIAKDLTNFLNKTERQEKIISKILKDLSD